MTTIRKKSRQVAIPYHAMNLHIPMGKQPMNFCDKWHVITKKRKRPVLDAGPMTTTPNCYYIFQ